ncbi:hypothetical protein ACHAWF_015874 [Thalassiosira exigua]
MPKFKEMTKSKTRQPALNGECEGVGAIICGETCPYCYGYDLEGDMEDEYYCWISEEGDRADAGEEASGVANKKEKRSIDLHNKQEWPELPPPSIATKQLVEMGVAIVEEHNSIFDGCWSNVSLDAGTLRSSDWDILSAAHSVRSDFTTTPFKTPPQSDTRHTPAFDRAANKQKRVSRQRGRSSLSDNDDSSDALYSMYDAVKRSRGGKPMYMYKREPKTPKGCSERFGPPCRTDRLISRVYNQPPIDKKKRDLKKFCSEWTG